MTDIIAEPVRHGPELKVTFQDDPRVVQEAATEDYSLHVAPRSWRSTRGSLAMAWYSLFSAMAWLIIPATIALAVGTINTIIGLALSVVAYGAINYVISKYAAESGLTLALFSRTLFGYIGASLAALLLAATAVYYCVFEGSVIAIAFQSHFGGLSLNLWYLVVVAYSVPLVFGGVRVWLDKFNGVLLPFYVIGLIVAIVWAISENGYSGDWFTYEPESTAGISGPGWLFAFTAFMGIWIMMMYTYDYARFGRREDEEFNGIVTFGPVFYLFTLLGNGVIGIFLSLTITTEGPLSEVSGVLGIVSLMGIFGVLLIWVSQTRINTANFYLASSNLQSFAARVLRLRLPRTFWVVVVGAIVYLIMLTDVFSFIIDALRYQGVFVVAWVGIALTHITFARRRGMRADQFEFRPGRVRQFHAPGLIAWFVASGLGVYLLEGVGAWGATWSAPVTFAVSIAIYAATLGWTERTWASMARPNDPRDEVADPWEARIQCATCERSYVALEMDRDPSGGLKPICAACATDSSSLHREAAREAAEVSS